MAENLVIESAEPFQFTAGENGCLLIHGFTGSPKEMRWMGEFLHKKDYTVLGIRLAGHATQPIDLIRARWWDWLASVEDGINLLSFQCKKIFAIGLSMGGCLALLASSRYRLDGTIAMSSPYALPDDWRLKIAKPLSIVKPFIAKSPDEMKNRKAAVNHVDYPAYPTRSIAELNELLGEMRKALPLIQIPVLLIHSEKDSGVPFENMHRIYESLATKEKQQLVLKKSSHVVTEDIERETVFSAAYDFITQFQ